MVRRVQSDGQRLASSGEDKTVKLWSASDGAALQTLRGHTLNVWSVAFSPDGQLLASGSFDKTVKIWRADTGALSSDFFRAQAAPTRRPTATTTRFGDSIGRVAGKREA